MADQKVYYKRARDFGQIFSATFGYIKQNFKTFYGSVLLYTLPFIALIGSLAAYIISSVTSTFSLFSRGGLPNVGAIILVIMIIMLLFLIVQTVYTTVVNQHLILNENLPEGEFVKRENIGASFFDSYWRVLGNALLLGLIAFFALLIYGIALALIVAGFSSLGVGGAIIGAMVQMAASFIVSPTIAFLFTTSMFVVQRDRISVVSALGKVFSYLKGNFWQTWAVSLAGYMMTNIMSVIVALPMIIFVVIAAVSRIKYDYSSGMPEGISTTTIIIGAALFILTVGLALCVASLYFLMCNFQFTSLEEKKEGTNIIDKINQI